MVVQGEFSFTWKAGSWSAPSLRHISAGYHVPSPRMAGLPCSACRRGADAEVCLTGYTLGGRGRVASPCASRPGHVGQRGSWQIDRTLAGGGFHRSPCDVLSNGVPRRASCTGRTRRRRGLHRRSTTAGKRASREGAFSASFFSTLDVCQVCMVCHQECTYMQTTSPSDYAD